MRSGCSSGNFRRAFLLQRLAPHTRCAPLPLVGRGRDGGSAIPSQVAPSSSRRITPQPSPTRGGIVIARKVGHLNSAESFDFQASTRSNSLLAEGISIAASVDTAFEVELLRRITTAVKTPHGASTSWFELKQSASSEKLVLPICGKKLPLFCPHSPSGLRAVKRGAGMLHTCPAFGNRADIFVGFPDKR